MIDTKSMTISMVSAIEDVKLSSKLSVIDDLVESGHVDEGKANSLKVRYYKARFDAVKELTKVAK